MIGAYGLIGILILVVVLLVCSHFDRLPRCLLVDPDKDGRRYNQKCR